MRPWCQVPCAGFRKAAIGDHRPGSEGASGDGASKPGRVEMSPWLWEIAHFVTPQETTGASRDETGNRILECAIAMRAQCGHAP